MASAARYVAQNDRNGSRIGRRSISALTHRLRRALRKRVSPSSVCRFLPLPFPRLPFPGPFRPPLLPPSSPDSDPTGSILSIDRCRTNNSSRIRSSSSMTRSSVRKGSLVGFTPDTVLLNSAWSRCATVQHNDGRQTDRHFCSSIHGIPRPQRKLWQSHQYADLRC